MTNEVDRNHYQGRELKIYDASKPKFDGTTSYRNEYKEHPLDSTYRSAPVEYKANSAPFDGTSTYGQQFVAHSLPERPPKASAKDFKSLPFEGSTSYAESYKGLASEAPFKVASSHWQPNTAKFDGTTSYKNDFTSHPAQGPTYASGTYAGKPRPSSLPFEGTTTYRVEYVPHPFDPAALPRNYALATSPGSNAPFDGTTSYRQDFIPHALEPRPDGAGKGAGSSYTSLPFEGTTTTRDAYQSWPYDASQHTARPQVPMRPSVPFSGTTTSREDFKGWQVTTKRRPPLGVELLGDKLHILIKPDAPLPAKGKQVFTTVHDNQEEMCVLILQGDANSASGCSVLGQFDLMGLPPGAAGSARVEVTLLLDANSMLSAHAIDLDSKRHEKWIAEGAMIGYSN